MPAHTAIILSMKSNQAQLTRSLSAIALSSIVVMSPLNAPAGIAVTDAGVIASLKVLNGTAIRIEGQANAINASTRQTANNTTQIMRDTSQINQTTLSTLPKIQEDIQKMREIGEARQKLSLQIAKLQELTTKGRVFKEDPFVDAVASKGVGDSMNQILIEMGEYMSSPWDLEGTPGLSSDHESEMKKNTFSASNKAAYYVPNTSGGAGGDMTLQTPTDAGMPKVLADYESLFGFSWRGYGFVGKNANYMQAMVGHGGRLLGFDYIPPVGSIALSETQRYRLQQIQKRSAFNNILKNHINANYRRVTQSGGNPWEVSPGLYVRPKTEADELFEKMVLSKQATPGSEVAFYAAASSYSKTQYDPFWGFSEKAEFSLPTNANDVLTRGAYSAIQAYLDKNGTSQEENPYGNFGKAIAPVIADLVDNAAPGCNLLITEADLQKASQMNGLSLKGVPTTPDEWRSMFARSEDAQKEYIRVVAAMPSAPPPSEVMVLFGLNKGDTKTYNSKILASSTRLSQNNKTLLTQVCLLAYNQKALQAVAELETALSNLSQSATELNIVEALPMMRDNVQNTILVLQNRIGQLQAQVDSLLKDKYEALSERQSIVEMYQKIIMEESEGQVERIMMNTAPTTLPM